ncbi:hypothetical protein D9613_003548 [Agrocybe pediades]|uniref:F-box domain-containing protein n=1 Tax=Agrocybe pediades TaxID=84607 RepID=A0A8H4VPL1_9AGAR|nr:hypothetical protein D9613_003548 [Agrocybe pediades]
MDIAQNTKSRFSTCVLSTQIDILYKIFEILIEENEDLRLVILRHGSQVCIPWRELLLSSPSMWGRSLDFDALMSKPVWRDEVIHRSGKSFAYITRLSGDGRPFDKDEELFLGSFVKDNWQRIKSLRISLPIESIVAKIFDTSLLQSPHLHLEDLEVRHYYVPRSEDSSAFTVSISRIECKADLGGYAPRLSRYVIGSTFKFPYQISWLPQLRELRVNLAECCIPNVCDELRNMTHLEHLELMMQEVRTADPDARRRISSIVLPRLKYLKIWGSMGNTFEAIDLVNFIKPAPECNMQVTIRYGDPLSPSDISSILSALPAFPLDDGKGGKDKQGWIRVDENSYRITSPRHKFDLRGPYLANLWTPDLQDFAASLASYFQNATNVRLLLGAEVVESIPFANITFPLMLSNMTSVSHITMDWPTFSLLRVTSVDDESSSKSCKALPALESFVLKAGNNADLNHLAAWLDYRAIHALKPIKRVGIFWNSTRVYPSLEAFQRFTNLEVNMYDWRGNLIP